MKKLLLFFSADKKIITPLIFIWIFFFTTLPVFSTENLIKPNGVTIYQTYTKLGQLQEYYASDSSFHYHFTYNNQGLLVKIEDRINHSFTTRQYNDFGRVINEEMGNGLSLQSSYDSIGRKTHLTLPDHSSIVYHYDPLYLREIERFSPNNELKYSHSYAEYNSNGLLTKESLIGSAGALLLAYDNQNQCQSITSSHWSQYIPENSIDSHANITTLEGNDDHGSWKSSFSYNEKQELIEESGLFEHLLTYDKNGNRTTCNSYNYIHNALNQLISQINGELETNYTYDLNGNLKEKISSKKHISYGYDALDRLTSVEINKNVKLHFTYDAFSRRLAKTLSRFDENSLEWVKEKTLRYLYDGDREIGAVDDQGSIIELRVLGSSRISQNEHSEIGAAVAHEIYGKAYAPIHDFRGNVCCLIDAESGETAEIYHYSAFGKIAILSDKGVKLKRSAIKNPWLFSSNRYDAETRLVYSRKRYYDPAIGKWTTKNPLDLFDGKNPYIFLQNNPLSHIDLYSFISFPAAKKEKKSALNNFTDALNSFKEKNSYTNHMEKKWDRLAEEFFGKGFLQFSGYYSHPMESGCTSFGKERNAKVRITLINGILNVRDDLEELLKLFSATHGNMAIHYVYRPTEGWTKDILSSTYSKMGFTSSSAKLLAETWKDMIREMGGINQGGKIIHYAHSIGATDTYVARNLLTPEERQMVHVITLGSPTLIPENSGFGSVINYVSKRDGVCLLDPIGYATSCLYRKDNVELVGSLKGIPLIDHTLYTDSYGGVIQELGKQFTKTYP